ncbi:MAG: pyridoxal-phosphate dependent enzyme [Alphaproteobacteria bacterium]|nr:pyridoxal-phosphate dependent enzyme [Alphaproteobacteria bacterium]MCB9796824.1 pyridoxal-phosphate dependent enzyme [Alphaproteobacteria bacterium]
MSAYAAELDDIRAAAARIAPYLRRTPVMRSGQLDALAGRRLHFKVEAFQKTGSFKARGALNAVLSLSEAEAARGVITHSSGNHGQAVAFAARARGIRATIVVPGNAPQVKVDAIRGYGAEVVLCAPTLDSRQETTARIIEETGATLVHSSDDPRVIAGQGTIALELLEQAPQLDAIVVPVGGGGMLSGIALAVRGLGHPARVFGAEPAGADDAARSKASGARVTEQTPDTIADGLRTLLGEHTWPPVRDLVEDILVVDDAATLAAMRLMWTRLKVLGETSSAVGLAAALDSALPAELQDVGIILCGGNVDLDSLPF